MTNKPKFAIVAHGTNFAISEASRHEWKVRVMPRIVPEFEEWCYATFGSYGLNRKYRWRKANLAYGMYFFREEADITLIVLRWQ